MIVITIPRILQHKLGSDGADALAETLNKMQESSQNNFLEIAETKFERRLVEETSKVREDLARTETRIIRYMFGFWIGQLVSLTGILSGILFAFFK